MQLMLEFARYKAGDSIRIGNTNEFFIVRKPTFVFSDTLPFCLTVGYLGDIKDSNGKTLQENVHWADIDI